MPTDHLENAQPENNQNQTMKHIGKIIGCHGLTGNLKVKTHDENPVWLGRLKSVYILPAELQKNEQAPVTPSGGFSWQQTKPVDIQKSWRQGKSVMIKLAGVNDRTAASPFIGSALYADLAAFADNLDKDTFFIDDLIGLTVIPVKVGLPLSQENETKGSDGLIFGTVADVLSTSGSDFLEIECTRTREKIIVPFQSHFFPVVDLKTKTIQARHIEELAEISAKKPQKKSRNTQKQAKSKKTLLKSLRVFHTTVLNDNF
ncbi:MAG: hypothetical protein AAGI66_04015 [Cyanobacteria bacterium P01_H01_bin.74]